jgi:hypothetical protein
MCLYKSLAWLPILSWQAMAFDWDRGRGGGGARAWGSHPRADQMGKGGRGGGYLQVWKVVLQKLNRSLDQAIRVEGLLPYVRLQVLRSLQNQECLLI